MKHEGIATCREMGEIMAEQVAPEALRELVQKIYGDLMAKAKSNNLHLSSEEKILLHACERWMEREGL